MLVAVAVHLLLELAVLEVLEGAVLLLQEILMGLVVQQILVEAVAREVIQHQLVALAVLA
jgi:hypothetical protein